MSDGKNPETDLRGAVALSHLFLRERVTEGQRAVDATCGNGHDTVLLARLVGERGRVWAFDVQKKALETTRELLAAKGCLGRVELVHAGHESLATFVEGPVSAVVFNLGYLPGGEKSFVTRPETTVTALDAAVDLLLPGGIVLVVIYTGHTGAVVEEEAVLAWGRALNPRWFNTWTSRQLNRPSIAPYLFFVEKRGERPADRIRQPFL